MRIVNKIFGKVESFLNESHINFIYTLYFNFRTMPMKTAFKLPVFIYGYPIISDLCGKVSFTCPPTVGMVKIGKHRDYYSPITKTVLRIRGGVVFNGKCYIAQGAIINVNSGTLDIGAKVGIGQSVLLDCSNNITIGYNTRIAFGCKVIDSNHHFVMNQNGNVTRKDGEIKIGKFNWIGNNSTVTKGCITSDNTIVSHGSLINKNYIEKYGTQNPMSLAGVPAKLISSGNIRIFSGEIEKIINKEFNSDSNKLIVDLALPLHNNETEDRYY